MKKVLCMSVVLVILLSAILPVTVSAAGENEFYDWLIQAESGESMEITKVTKTANQLLSIRLVKDAIDDEQLEIVRSKTPQEIEVIKAMLSRVTRGVSFDASEDAVKYFKAASKNAPFVDIGFAEYEEVDFNIGFAIAVDDTFVSESKTYYVYRYDSDKKRLVELGEATVLFERMKPYMAFETNCVDDFFVTDRRVDVDYIQNNAPPEKQSSVEVNTWENMPAVVRIMIIALAVVIFLAAFGLIAYKIIKKQI